MLGRAFHAIRGLFPFTRSGRQTLVYGIFAGAGPALTLLVWWAMAETRTAGQWPIFAKLAYIVASSLLIIVTGLAMFVSIRAVKLGKDGFEAQGDNDRDDAPAAAQAVASAAADKAEEITEGRP